MLGDVEFLRRLHRAALRGVRDGRDQGRCWTVPEGAGRIWIDNLYPVGYTLGMFELRKTAEFTDWLDNLRDLRARARIQIRLRRLMDGNPGDVKPVGEGVSEMRVDVGAGYRVYYAQRRGVYVLLLCGGDKSTQRSDIARALQMARELED